MNISDIIVGTRHRRDIGDIQSLADSITAVGLMHPPVVTVDNTLVAGFRRIKAAELLGWAEIPVRVIDTDALLQAEHDENECRKDFTPSERVAIADAIKAKIPVKQGQKPTSGQMARSERPRDEAAKAAGFESEQEYRRAKKVVEEGEPELVAAMDNGSIPVSTAAKAAKLPPKKQRAIAAAEEPAKAARAEVKKQEVKIVPPAAVDAWDIPIQDHAVEAFDAVPRFHELIATIQLAQKQFNALANLAGGKFLTLPDVSSYRRGRKNEDGTHADRFVHEGLEKALRQVQNAIPTHTVCPWHYVDGAHPEECGTCRGLNWTPVLGSNIPDMAKERAKKAFNVK